MKTKHIFVLLLACVPVLCFGFQESEVDIQTHHPDIDLSVFTEKNLDSMYSLLRALYNDREYEKVAHVGPAFVEIALKHKNAKVLIQTSSVLATVYQEFKDYDAAEKIYLSSLKEAQKPENLDELANVYLCLGLLHIDKNDIQKALNYFKKSYQEATSQNHYNGAMACYAALNLSDTYLDLSQDDQAQEYLNKIQSHIKQDSITGIQKRYIQWESSHLQGKIYLGQNKPKLAIQSFNTFDELRGDNRSNHQKDNYLALLQAYEQIGDYEAINEVRKKYETLLVTEFENDKASQTQVISSKYQINKIQNELLASQFKNKLVVLGGILLLIFIGLLLASRFKIKKLVTNLKSKNIQYAQAKEHSEKLLNQNTKFLSTITHELRTPLYGIIGLTSMFQNEVKLKDFRKDMSALKFSADYLLSLINDVLLLNKESFNHGPEKEVHFDLRQVINSIVQNLEFLNKKNKNTIEVQIDPLVPEVLVADKTKVSQIFFNLMSNASKFTANGSILAKVEAIQIQDPIAHLACTIKDSGKGIAAEDQNAIFNEFTQLQETETRGSSGLGLTIVKALLKDFDSKITLESELGKGSTFSFNLALPIGSKTIKAIEKKHHVDQLQNKRVLIVDDNKINLLVTHKVLQQFQMKCSVAHDGLEALDIVSSNAQFDVILMDINMPKMNGFETSRKIRELGIDTPIIALTAAANHNQKTTLEENGIDAIIIKPYENGDLSNLLIEILNS